MEFKHWFYRFLMGNQVFQIFFQYIYLFIQL